MADSVYSKTADLDINHAVALSNMGTIHLLQKNYEKAETFFRRSLHMSKRLKHAFSEKMSYFRLAELFSQIGAPDSTRHYLKQCIAFFDDQNITHRIAESKMHFGVSLIDDGRLGEAETYIQEAIGYANLMQDTSKLAECHELMGRVNQQLGRHKKAITHYSTALSMAEQTELLPIQVEASSGLSNAYEQKGAPFKALKYARDFKRLDDSLSTLRKQERVLELEEKYESAQQEKKISNLSAEKSVLEQKRKNQLLTFLFALFSILAVSIVIWTMYRSRSIKNKELKKVDRIKNKFFGNISHELRTPLTIIKGLSQDLINDGRLSEVDEARTKTISKNANRLDFLANQILTLNAIDSNALQVEMVQSDVIRFLKEYILLFKSFTRSNHQELKLQIHCNELVMDFDPNHMQTIVNNILGNAIKFSPENSEIKVDISKEGQQLLIQIEDEGPGIQETELQDIFKRYYTKDDVGREGLGIGLSLVKELTEAMGGGVKASSKNSRGTTFGVYLPIRNKGGAASDLELQMPFVEGSSSSAAEPLPAVFRDQTILIVEDDIDIQNYLKSLVQDKYSYHVASNGLEALSILEEKPIDFIISDLIMPKMDGKELCKVVKEDLRYSHIPFIMLSAKNTERDIRESYKVGADLFLAKPFDKRRLVIIIKNLIEKQERLKTYFSSLLRKPQYELDSESEWVGEKDYEFILSIQEWALGQNKNDSVSGLTKKVGMSRTSLHNKIKALTGRSTTEYLNWVKIEKSKEMIRSKNYSMKEIAYRLGFSDPSYFSRVFKNMTGQSPSEFSDS